MTACSRLAVQSSAVLACLLFLASSLSVHAGGLSGLAFYSDPACTVSFSPTSIPGVNTTYTQWSSVDFVIENALNLSAPDAYPPCQANPLPAFPFVASGEYGCFNDEVNDHSRGFGAAEYVLPGCDRTAAQLVQFQLFFFQGPQGSTCAPGQIITNIQTAQGEVFGGASNRSVYATFTCTNNGSGAVRLGVSGVGGLLGMALLLLLVTAL